MHTSTMLTPADFTYERAGSRAAVMFDDVFTGYHPLDRTAVAWIDSVQAVRSTNLAMLALTTAFYESLRRRHTGEFFDYPQHFALGATAAGAPPAEFPAGAAWSMLDVWPDCKRKLVAGGVCEMLAAAFELQINRVLWPATWWTSTAELPAGVLPAHMLRMLRTSLKQVLVYNDDPSPDAHARFDLAAADASIRIVGTRAVATVLEGVYPHLPESRRPASSDASLASDYLVVTPAVFLSRYARCFAA